DVPREVVGAGRGPPPAGLVSLRDERGGERVLDAGAQPGEQQDAEERPEAPGSGDGHVAGGGERRAGGEEPPLAHPLGQHARRHLEESHAARVRGPGRADLGEGQPELARPQRQEDVEEVGEGVVEEVGAARGREHAPRAAVDGGRRPRRRHPRAASRRTRRSPTRTVSRWASRYSSSGIAYLRETPRRSLMSWGVI